MHIAVCPRTDLVISRMSFKVSCIGICHPSNQRRGPKLNLKATGETMENRSKGVGGYFTRVRGPLDFLLLLVALFGGGYTAISYIDSRIQQRIMEPDVLKAIASEVRPAVIIDSESRVLADQGGLRYIDHFEFIKSNGRNPDQIILTPRGFLAEAPMVESLDVEGYNIEAKRGKGLEWRYNLVNGAYVESGVKVPRFRIEIVR